MIKAVIADDEKAVVSIIKHFIEKEHLPIQIVGVADNGKTALQLINDLKPQLVFIDIQMPIYNGLEVIEAAKNNRYIIITAYNSFDYAQQALRLGAKDIILKPIEYAQLIQAISRAIGWNFTSNNTVNTVLEYLHDNYSQQINITNLSQTVCTTPYYLTRLFKKHTGTSIINYMHKLRIEKAKELLPENGCNIQQVAEESGYESLNNFYKYFKQHTNMTPAAFCQMVTK